MTQFKVVLDGVELSREQQGRIAARVQQAVLEELVDYDTKGDRVAALFPRFPWGVAGLIWSPVGDEEALRKLLEIEHREFSEPGG